MMPRNSNHSPPNRKERLTHSQPAPPRRPNTGAASISDMVSMAPSRAFIAFNGVAPLRLSAAGPAPPRAENSCPSCSPGARTAAPGASGGQAFICSGKHNSANTQPAMAGLNRLRPKPPKTCLAMRIAKAMLAKEAHQDSRGETHRANNSPVATALPSRKKGRGSRRRKLRAAASNNRANAAANRHCAAIPQPNNQT